MDLKKLSHDALIDYCKDKQINYMTKLKKPMAKRSLITLLTKLPEIKKTQIIDDTKIKLQSITDEIITIKLGDIFDLIKNNINNQNILYDDKGITLITNENKNRKIKQLNDVAITNGNNIFIGLVNINNKISIKYNEGRCYYTNTMILCKLKDNEYNDRINIKYIYYYLLYKKSYINATYQRGLTNKSLDTYIFSFMQIPLPPLKIQEEIIKDIDDLNTIIDSKKILLKNLHYETEIYIKYLNKNYENVNLNDICKILPKSLLKPTDGESEGIYPFFNNAEKINKYTTINDYDNESIIIVEDNKVAIYYAIKFSAANNCIIMQNKNIENVNLKFIYNYLQLINFTNNYEIKIPLPQIKTQDNLCIELEKYIENKNKSLKIIERNINETKNIKNHLFSYIIKN